MKLDSKLTSKHLARGLALVSTMALAACGGGFDDRDRDDDDDRGEQRDDDDRGGNDNDDLDPGDGSGGDGQTAAFSGEWSGSLLCQGHEDSGNGPVPGQFQQTWYATFDASGDLLLPGPNGPVAQTQAGTEIRYVPEGGGVGSVTLLSVDKRSDFRGYSFRISENRTSNYGDGYSETYNVETSRSDAYTLAGGAIEARIELDITTDHIVSGPDVYDGHSRSQLVGTCTGTLRR